MNEYFQLAIGKALWPIEVTQFSTHCNFSSDLMDSEKILHVFNDETSRNAILALKVLINRFNDFHALKNKN
jgi:hypothetical protein